MTLHKIDWIILTIVALSLLALSEILKLFSLNNSDLNLVICIGISIIIIQIEIYRRTQAHLLNIDLEQKYNYRQIESLFSLFSSLTNKAPIPAMREWAISPDFAKLVMSYIYEYQPKTIVELGSGVSTIISGYCLQSIGSGKVISIDGELEYAEATMSNLNIHGLQNIAEVIYAPLKEVVVENETFKWYDLKN